MTIRIKCVVISGFLAGFAGGVSYSDPAPNTALNESFLKNNQAVGKTPNQYTGALQPPLPKGLPWTASERCHYVVNLKADAQEQVEAIIAGFRDLGEKDTSSAIRFEGQKYELMESNERSISGVMEATAGDPRASRYAEWYQDASLQVQGLSNRPVSVDARTSNGFLRQRLQAGHAKVFSSTQGNNTEKAVLTSLGGRRFSLSAWRLRKETTDGPAVMVHWEAFVTLRNPVNNPSPGIQNTFGVHDVQPIPLNDPAHPSLNPGTKETYMGEELSTLPQDVKDLFGLK